MLVDVYEKTRTIEVPYGDKSVKICKVDMTGLGYSREVEIHAISRGTLSISRDYIAIVEDSDKLNRTINRLKSNDKFQEEQKHALYDEIRKAYAGFGDVLRNAPIRRKVKEELLESYADAFRKTRQTPWRNSL